MTLKDLKREALRLKPKARADLAARLLESLDDLSEEEWIRLWAEEAARRDAEMDAADIGRPAHRVFRDLRSKLR